MLEGPGREADLADLAGQGPPEVLPVEQPLDLALAALGDVEAVAVEEPHDHRLRVVLDEADRDAPTALGWRARKRVTGTDATSRSSTLTPAALMPAIIARFSMRADRDESRDVMTVDSFLSVVA